MRVGASAAFWWYSFSLYWILRGLIWLWDVTTVEDKRIMQLNAAGVNSRFFEPGPQHPEFEDTPKRFVDWYCHALAGDFSVIPPTVRTHRTSSCEMTEHP